MSETPPLPMGIPLEIASQIAMGQAVAQAKENLGFDVPRAWANNITVNIDEANATATLLFREGFQIAVNQQPNGLPAQTQEIFRNISSVVVPLSVLKLFAEVLVHVLGEKGAS